MRWKALIPTVVVLSLIGVFTVFFLDGAVKCALEAAGTRMNGAKVELDDVNINLRKMSVTLRGLQVADPDSPMINTLDVESLRFDLAAKPLAWKKIIVENAEIIGLATGTPRKSSGAVSKKKKPATEERPADKDEPSALAEKGQETFSFAMANLKEQYDPKKLVQLENLASYQKIKGEQDRLPALTQGWESKADAVNLEAPSDRVKAFVQRVKSENFSGAEGLKKAKDILSEGKKLKADLEQTKKQLAELKASVMAEVSQAKNALKEIDKLRQQDMDNALGQVKSGFSAEGITRGLIGPEWFGKIQKALGWFHKIRKIIPQKKEEETPPPPDRRGRDIHFPFRYNWPAFHLKNAGLSGVTAGTDPLTYKGTLKDVTSDPKKVGKPIALEISGKSEAGPQSLSLRGEFDYTTDTPREQVRLRYAGIGLADTKLGQVGAPVSIREGNGVVTADLTIKAEKIAGDIRFEAAPVVLEQTLSAEQKKNRLLQILHDVLTTLDRLNVTVAVSDTLTSPDFKLSTNVDDAVKNAVKQVLSKELEELKASFRARVSELVDGEKQKLTSQLDGKTGGITDKFNKKDQLLQSAQGQIDQTLEDLKTKGQSALPIPGTGAPADAGESKPALPDLKGIFKKR
ncbi:MAG TPA: TIGR03545 family protein [Elusimicrobiota bacterium]|nr:TIGR03545 family protein [Elusimicrobiota bacterium]